MAELLLAKGYAVYGMARNAEARSEELARILPGVKVVSGDLGDETSILAAVRASEPDEVYNLGAISFAGRSFEEAAQTGDVTGLGVVRVLEALRQLNPAARFYQASSSEMFDATQESPQSESSPLHPRSPYGCAKVYGHNITTVYRERYGVFACSGILFNHESPRRGVNFVTRKITLAAARISLGLQNTLSLGDLEARRDWGFAGDYVDAMHRMMTADEPGDYVVATGLTHSVRQFCEHAFAHVGLDYRDHVFVDPAFARPAETGVLVGDAHKARERLGWTAAVGFSELVTMMVESDLARERAVPGAVTSAVGRPE